MKALAAAALRVSADASYANLLHRLKGELAGADHTRGRSLACFGDLRLDRP